MNIEACESYGIGAVNVLEFGFMKDEHRIHEAQKPVRLVSFLIDLTTKEGQTVLDPFMGSGTTALAARRLNRRFIGFEAADDFHKAASQRLRDEDGREGMRGRSQPLLL